MRLTGLSGGEAIVVSLVEDTLRPLLTEREQRLVSLRVERHRTRKANGKTSRK